MISRVINIATRTNLHQRRGFFRSIQLYDDLPIIIEKNNIDHSKVFESAPDLSEISPYFQKSFNLAGYVNSSETLKRLVDLQVNLSKIEKKPYIANALLKLNFEKDIEKFIWFLKDFVEDLGSFITKNPMIFCEDLDNIQVRINYLESKHFNYSQICRIISKNPFWLMFSTDRIDKRLGYFQSNYKLSGEEVRYLASKQPRLVTYNLKHIKTNYFAIKEEMGFSDLEIKKMILDKPQLLMIDQKKILWRFNYLHNDMNVDHDNLLKNTGVLLCRNFKIQQRHLFLKALGRAQYDPHKENYVPIKALAEGTDVEFCKKHAKCNVVDFNLFLKTL